MEVTRITGTRSKIYIEIGEKTVTGEGEMLTGGFIVQKGTMKFEPPFENHPLTDDDKEEIIEAVARKAENSKMNIIFE